METIKNLQKVSLVFFIIIGLIHLVTSLIINRTFDLPFAFSALLYGLSSLKINLNHFYPEKKSLNVLLPGLGIISLGLLIYFNFFTPDI